MEPERKGYPPLAPAARPIRWEHSAGVFIGVQEFHAGAGLTVPYAADDAVDLAYLLTRELELLPPRRTTLLLAGRPSKDSSRRSLEELRMEATVVEDDERGFGPRKWIDAATVASAVRARAREVEQGGVLVLSIATHGLLVGGDHLLLTADASRREPHGIHLATILDAIKTERPERLLLLIDTYRVYVALTAGPNFLSGKSEWPYVPLNEGANRIVHWNGPVEVTRIANDRRKKP